MRQIISFFVSIILPTVFINCSSSWKVTNAQFKGTHYYFQTPPKWMIFRDGINTVLSNHGPSLEKIQISREKTSETRPFTTLRISPDMLPHEIGEILLSEKIANANLSNVQLIEESVAEIDGRRAVRLTIDYQINSITTSNLIYAFVDDEFLYTLKYSAVKRYYFKESLDEFETVIKSFKIQ